MSQYLNFDDHIETDDIDALNDETFGCDVGEINDNWEEEHEKFVETTHERSSEFIDTGSIVHCDPKDSLKLTQNHNRDSFHENHYHFGSNSKLQQRLFNDDILFPNCEDLITKSLLDVVSDESDLYGSGSGFSINQYIDDSDDLLQNGMFKSNVNKSHQSSQKEKAKNIDLESLRPPSPSILPLDHTFMSNVWRPPSPPPTETTNNNITINNQQNYSPKGSPAKTLTTESDIFKSPNKFSYISKYIVRAEDLEADLSHNSTSLSIVKSSTPNNRNVTSNLQKFSSSNHQSTSNKQQQTPPNAMELSALSTPLLHPSVMTNNSNTSSFTIPSSLISKVIQPPPGFLRTSNNQNNKIPSPLGTFDAKSSSNQPIINSNNKLLIRPNTVIDPRFSGRSSMTNAMIPSPKISMPSPNLQMLPVPTNVLDPMFQQQRSIINKCIITPAQAQRSYHHQHFFNRNHHHQQQDKFAGFMTQKEKDWLVKIFRLQCKVNDPYVEDYYEVNYMLKKNSLKFFMAKQKESCINEKGGNEKQNPSDDSNSSSNNKLTDSEPILVLPQMAPLEEYKPKYIQFDNALGKIQVLNSKCPRKLVEFNENDTSFEHFKLDQHSQYLLKIERLYEHLLNIEDEDKRMPILPDNVKQQHRNRRSELCNQLFKGLTITISDIKKDESHFFILINRVMLTLKRIPIQIDPNILKINKGLLLVVRSLIQLEDEYHLIVLTSALLKTNRLEKLTQIEDENKIDLGNILLKALTRIKSAKALIYLVSNIEYANIFTNNKHGFRLLVSLFKQYELSEDKLLFIYFWTLFVQTLIKQIPENEETYKICKEHLNYLNQI